MFKINHDYWKKEHLSELISLINIWPAKSSITHGIGLPAQNELVTYPLIFLVQCGSSFFTINKFKQLHEALKSDWDSSLYLQKIEAIDTTWFTLTIHSSFDDVRPGSLIAIGYSLWRKNVDNKKRQRVGGDRGVSVRLVETIVSLSFYRLITDYADRFSWTSALDRYVLQV